MIAVGLFTRVAALAQLPILIGAVFVVHLQSGLLAPAQSLEFSALVLFLLILLVLWGSGRLSVDRYIVEQPAGAEHYRHAQALDKEATEAEPLLPSEFSPAPAATCSCGHGRDHPRVSPHARYGMFSAVYFLAGATGRPQGDRVSMWRLRRDRNQNAGAGGAAAASVSAVRGENPEDSRMALKKSQLYSSLWQSCDELRGGMDASQYKDYVLTLLFMKYVSDKPDHAHRNTRWRRLCRHGEAQGR